MVALVGAMFVALQSASAADGMVTVEIGETDDTSVTGLNTAYDAATTPETVTSNTDASDDIARVGVDSGTLTVEGVRAGTTTATLSDADDDDLAKLTYEITVLPFGFAKIESDDSDDIVKAGKTVLVTVTLNSQTDSSEVTLTVPTTGLSLVKTNQAGTAPADGGTTQSQTLDTDSDTKQATFTVLTAGAPEGAYTLTFVANRTTTPDNTDATKDVTDTSFKLTIGDPGDSLHKASLDPDNVNADGTAADPKGSADSLTKPAGHTIHLVVQAENSLGKPSNDGDVSQVIVFATGAGAKVNGEDNGFTFKEVKSDGGTVTTPAPGAKQAFTVTKATPGTVTVRATVVGGGTDVRTNELELVFSGTAEEISLGEPTDQLEQQGDDIMVELTAVDGAGNKATIGTLQTTSIKVLDADGNTAKNISASEAQKMDTKGTDAIGDDTPIDTVVVITIESSKTAKAASGTYTLEVKLGSKSTATSDFTVVGDANSIEVTVTDSEPSAYGTITATATVLDENGEPVANETMVTFDSSEPKVLTKSGKKDDKATKDGMATQLFTVTGPGTAVITASVNAVDVSGVTVITSTAGMVEPEAMPEEEASVGCLSNLSGFSTWSCGVESSASEIFGLVSARGVTAIHLHNGTAWVRYSVVDGAMVPGSSDFMVTENDILYISN